jgi:hypothetical protein
MGTIISEGLLPSDDPMFTGKVETFSVHKPKPPPTAPHSGTTSEKPKFKLDEAHNSGSAGIPQRRK